MDEQRVTEAQAAFARVGCPHAIEVMEWLLGQEQGGWRVFGVEIKMIALGDTARSESLIFGDEKVSALEALIAYAPTLRDRSPQEWRHFDNECAKLLQIVAVVESADEDDGPDEYVEFAELDQLDARRSARRPSKH